MKHLSTSESVRRQQTGAVFGSVVFVTVFVFFVWSAFSVWSWLMFDVRLVFFFLVLFWRA
jgi:hypothetical protein